MGYKNLTIRGKTDGFGCQWNAKERTEKFNK